MRDTLPAERWYHVLGVDEETGEDMILTPHWEKGFEWRSQRLAIQPCRFPSAALAMQTAHRVPGTKRYHNWTEPASHEATQAKGR